MFKAHAILYRSTLGSRAIEKKKKQERERALAYRVTALDGATGCKESQTPIAPGRSAP